MRSPDPSSIVACALREVGAATPILQEQIVVRPCRGVGDWYSPVAYRLAQGQRAEQSARDLAGQLRSRPEVCWADSQGGGVLFSVHDAVLARTLETKTAQPLSRGGRPAPWPSDLWPVAFAHARCRSLSRTAAAHEVQSADAQVLGAGLAAILNEPHARRLLVHAATVMTRARPEPVLLVETAGTFQEWFAATRITPRGREPVTSYHRIRLALNHATAFALATGLASLGLDAPEHL